MARVWYTNRDREPIDWVSTVSGGRALTDILRIVDHTLDNDPTVTASVWRAAGTTITSADLVAARSEGAGGTPPAQIVAWTPPRARFITPFDLEYRLNNLTVGDGAHSFYSKSQVDSLLGNMQLTVDTLQQQLVQESERFNSVTVDLSTVRTIADATAFEVAQARSSYGTLAQRLDAIVSTIPAPGTGTTPGTGTPPSTGSTVYCFTDANGFVIADSTGELGKNRLGIDSDGLPYYDPAGAANPTDAVVFVNGYPAFDDASVPPTGAVRIPTASGGV